MKPQPRTRPALTLLELVVVLAILAVLTLVAVTATESTVEQTRFDVTRQTLDNVETAVLGPLNQTDSDGTRAITGFVADTGRLPVAVGTDPTTQLAELWSNPNALPAFGLVAATSDPDVKLLLGWRGPYLRLPTLGGTQRLADGWGNPFALLKADATTPAAAGDEIAFVRSTGGPNSPYNVPLDLSQPFIATSYTGTVAGTLTDSESSTAGTQDVTVRLYRPSPAGVTERSVTATAATGYRFEFIGVPIGPKVIRAYQATRKSDIIHLRVPPGGMTRNITLDLQ